MLRPFSFQTREPTSFPYIIFPNWTEEGCNPEPSAKQDKFLSYLKGSGGQPCLSLARHGSCRPFLCVCVCVGALLTLTFLLLIFLGRRWVCGYHPGSELFLYLRILVISFPFSASLTPISPTSPHKSSQCPTEELRLPAKGMPQTGETLPPSKPLLSTLTVHFHRPLPLSFSLPLSCPSDGSLLWHDSVKLPTGSPRKERITSLSSHINRSLLGPLNL